MSIRRGGTPLLGAGIPSLEASNQSQINDLVQRNRTLEHTNQKLAAQIEAEIARGKDAVQAIQAQHDASQRQWKEGCEDLLASYRIVQKRLELEIERERRATIEEMEVTREEKLQRMQRDFKITLFQMKEEELERRVEDIEEEASTVKEEYNLTVQKLRDKCADTTIKLKDAQEALIRSEKDRKDKEAKLNKLREAHANLEASNSTHSSKVQRIKLQLDMANNRVTKLESDNDELKRFNADLTRQLENWQSLDTKEGAAAEKERKQRVALEQKLVELQEKEEESARELEKEKRRVSKMMDTTAQWKTESETLSGQVDELTKQHNKAQKQISKLKEELEVERARVRPISPQKQRKRSPTPEDVEGIEEIEEESEPPQKLRKGSTKPDSKRVRSVKAGVTKKPTPEESDAPPRLQIARKTASSGRPPKKAAAAKKAVVAADSDSEVQVISNPQVEDEEQDKAPHTKRKGKGKAAADEDEAEESAATTQKQGKGKRKPSEEDEDEPEIAEQPKAKKGARSGSAAPRAGSVAPAGGTTRGRSKQPGSRAGSRQPSMKPRATEKSATGSADEGDGDNDATAPKKKKRKINIFPTNDKGSMALLAQFGNNGLDIPTILSPVRQDEPVPQRSTASSIAGGFGSLFRR